MPLDIPRDRAGSFTPQLEPKGVRRLPKFDAMVLSLYARGLTVREIQGRLEALYEIPIALLDRLAGFPEAITMAFRQSQVHHCVVHLGRGSLS